MANVLFKRGTSVEYNALPEKDPNALYFLTDVMQFWVGDKFFGTGAEASEQAAGLLSSEDKAALDKLIQSGVVGFTPVDGSIVIDAGDAGNKTIGVQLSKKEHNAIKLEDDGLFVDGDSVGAEYEIEQAEDAGDAQAVYKLKKTVNGESTYAGVDIKIPKDKVIKGGSLKTVTEPDTPYSGAQVGDPYLDITLANDEETHVYIPVKGIVDTSDFVIGSIKSGKGEALIANDETGGGAWFIRPDGIQGYVGVNDGSEANGKGTPMAQLYAAKKEEDGSIKDGSFLSAYQDKITYVSQSRAKNGGKLSDPMGEIAILDDIEKVKTEARVLYTVNHYEITNLLDGCRVDMNGREIRVMFPKDAHFVKPEGHAEGRDNDCYYFGVKVYAPSDDVTGFKESDKETVPPETEKEGFDGPSSGIDAYGRKYDICWFPAAKWTEPDTWTYYGKESKAGMCIGWYHTIEWYKEDVCVGSETVRINLTNEECHNSLKTSLGKNNAPEGVIVWEEM